MIGRYGVVMMWWQMWADVADDYSVHGTPTLYTHQHVINNQSIDTEKTILLLQCSECMCVQLLVVSQSCMYACMHTHEWSA